MLVEVLVLELVSLLLEEAADGEGDRGEAVQAGRQVWLAGGREGGWRRRICSPLGGRRTPEASRAE